MASPRIRSTITLISPSGQEFICRWAGGTRSVSKRLARYSYAGVNGEVVDDYGVEADTHPIQLIFEGDNYDIEAKRFFDVFHEIGKWEVNHPTDGLLFLQGVRATENDQRISEGNIIKVDTEWTDYLDPQELRTLRNQLIALGMAINEFDEAQADKLIATMKTDVAGIEEARESGRTILEALKSGYKQYEAYSSEGIDRQNDLVGLLNSSVITAAGLASSVKNAILAPSRGIQDIKVRLTTFSNILSSIFRPEREPVSPKLNDSAVKEVSAAAVASAAATAVLDSLNQGDPAEGGIVSRETLIEVLDTFTALINSITTYTDAEHQKYQGEYVEDVYIPFGDTASNLDKMTGLAVNVLLTQFYDLPTTIEPVIKADTTVLELAYLYYGSLGEDDKYVNRIIDSNALSAEEILRIPQGRSIKLYGVS